MTSDELKTERTRVRRLPDRGHYDAATIHAILDAVPICHVGYVIDGMPSVTPTFHWREGDHVYWHGSRASGALRAQEGADVCLTVTLLDGMVLARSAFNHSANYRSAMIFGRPTAITDEERKRAHLETFVNALFPDRWDLLRPVKEKELAATTVLSMPISEASAKIRTGDPHDDEEDYALPIWAGVLPITLHVGEPIPDPRNLPGAEEPEGLRDFRLG